ncbi:MAG: hypothetical protein ABIJ09_22470 [Pseudomonadota bacterium]
MQLDLFVDSLDTVVRRLRLAGALLGQSTGQREALGMERGVDPAVFLTSLIDFRGGIALEAALRSGVAQSPEGVEAAAATSETDERPWPATLEGIRARAREELAGVANLLQVQLQGAGVGGMLSPFRLHRVLTARGALDTSQVDRMAAPFDLRLRQALLLIPREVARVRRPLGAALRTLGPRQVRLERLDAALLAATHGDLERLQARLVVAYHAAFERGLQLALGSGPVSSPEALAVVLEPGGWVHVHFELGQQVAQTMLVLARSRIDALLRASAEPTTKMNHDGADGELALADA